MTKLTLIIPVEIKSRDLYGRLYLAHKAVKKGHRALIGPSKALHSQLPRFPRGIIIEDDITFQGRNFFKTANSFGYGLASIDEESIAVTTDRRYVMQRVHYPNLQRGLIHFTRGDGDRRQIIEDAPDKSLLCNLVPAGNPRIDLLQERYTGQYEKNCPHAWNPDDVILVNSRFSRSNPFNMTRLEVRDVVRRKFNFTQEQFEEYCGYLDHTDKLFDAFAPMAEKLPQIFPDKIIVYRPHPSENFKFWQDMADRYENARCIHTGTAVQWSINARAMIHTGCTTAIESALLGANVFAFCPIVSDEYDVRMANIVSHIVKSENELFEELGRVHAPDHAEKLQNSRKAREYLSQHVAGCQRKESSDIILDALEALEWKPDRASLNRHLKDIKWMLRYGLKAMQKDTTTGYNKRAMAESYHNQKFPHTDTAEINEILRQFGAGGLCAKPYGPNWWEIFNTDFSNSQA